MCNYNTRSAHSSKLEASVCRGTTELRSLVRLISSVCTSLLSTNSNEFPLLLAAPAAPPLFGGERTVEAQIALTAPLAHATSFLFFLPSTSRGG